MPFSEWSMVLRLIVCRDCSKSSTRSRVLLAKPMSRAVWMTSWNPGPSTTANGQMSYAHMLTRELVMLALA